MVAAVFEFRTCGTGEVGEGHMEKELEFLYWYYPFKGFTGPTDEHWYWYRGTGSLGCLQIKEGSAR